MKELYRVSWQDDKSDFIDFERKKDAVKFKDNLSHSISLKKIREGLGNE